MKIFLENMISVVDLVIYFVYIFMVLTWNLIKYMIKIKWFLGMWTLNCLVPPKYSELMRGCLQMSKVDVSQ